MQKPPQPETKVESRQPVVSILDRPIGKQKSEVAFSSFAYLFSELVQYAQAKVDSTQQLERLLADAGYGIGVKMLELSFIREKMGKRERNLIAMLQFLSTNVWKSMFGKQADGLEKSTDRADEYYVYDKEPITNRFMSIPANLGNFNCAAFIAGIVNGFLDGAEFNCTVTACFNTVAQQQRTVYVVRFNEEVLAREAEIAAQ